MGRNLTNLPISASFQYLLQKSGSDNYLNDGVGNDIDLINVTSSWAISASNAVQAVTASYAEFASGSTDVNAVYTASATDATITFEKGDASTFDITIDNVANATSASYAATASYLAGGVTLQAVTDEGNTTTNGITVDNTITTRRVDVGGSGINGVINVYSTVGAEIFRATATGVQIGGLSQNYDLLHYGNTTQNGNVNVTGAVTASAGFKGDLDGNAATATIADSASKAQINETGDNASYRMAFVNDAGAGGIYDIIYHDDDGTFTYNPSTDTMEVANINIGEISGSSAVFASASIGYLETITGSATIIGDAYVIVNTSATTRYAGLKVYESGSATQASASLNWDSQTQDWFYEYSGSDATDYAIAMFGPEYATKGSPVYLTNNTIPKADGKHHFNDSNIIDDGTTVTINANVSASGYISASAFIGDGSGLTGAAGLVSGTGTDSMRSADSLTLAGGATAGGDESIALGRSADAQSIDSVAIGTLATATGNKGVAIGEAANAITVAAAYGRLAKANNYGSLALGNQAQCDGDRSVALGFQTDVDNIYGVAIGHLAQATGSYNVAFNANNAPFLNVLTTNQDAIFAANVSASAFHGDGSDLTNIEAGLVSGLSTDSIKNIDDLVTTPATASGAGDIAIGNGALANGGDSVAIGNGAVSSGAGQQFVAIGAGASTDYQGVALGANSTAAFSTTAVGYNSNAGNYGTAYGWGADASLGGTAIGRGATSANNSVNIGGDSLSDDNDSVAIGTSTDTDNQYGLALGHGAQATGSLNMDIRANNAPLMMATTASQDVYFQASLASFDGVTKVSQSLTVGDGHTATGTNGVATGQNNNATGLYSGVYSGVDQTASGERAAIVAGFQNDASGTDSFVGGGWSNDASGLRSAVFAGTGNSTTATYSAVLAGSSNTAGHEASVVIGGNGLSSTKTSEVTVPNLTISGSAVGEVSALTITSNTASMDCSTGNFFTLTLQNATNTHLDATNIQPGQTINLKVTQNATSAGDMTFAPEFEFEGGTAFVPSAGTSEVDVMTFISFDGTSLQATGLKNFS